MTTTRSIPILALALGAMLLTRPLVGEQSGPEQQGVPNWSSTFSHMCYQGPDRCDEWLDGSGSSIGMRYYNCNGLYNFHTLTYVVYYCEA